MHLAAADYSLMDCSRRIESPPTTLQLREMAAHLAFSNMRLQERPSFHTSFLENGEPVMRPGHCATYSRVASSSRATSSAGCSRAFALTISRGTSEWKDIEEPLLQGRYTFLVDSDGKALVDKQ